MNWVTLIPTVYGHITKGLEKFFKWRKGRYEDEVDKAVLSGNAKRVASIMRKIRKDRETRKKQS